MASHDSDRFREPAVRTLAMPADANASGDIFGRIYEYFLTGFADLKAHRINAQHRVADVWTYLGLQNPVHQELSSASSYPIWVIILLPKIASLKVTFTMKSEKRGS